MVSIEELPVGWKRHDFSHIFKSLRTNERVHVEGLEIPMKEKVKEPAAEKRETLLKSNTAVIIVGDATITSYFHANYSHQHWFMGKMVNKTEDDEQNYNLIIEILKFISHLKQSLLKSGCVYFLSCKGLTWNLLDLTLYFRRLGYPEFVLRFAEYALVFTMVGYAFNSYIELKSPNRVGRSSEFSQTSSLIKINDIRKYMDEIMGSINSIMEATKETCNYELYYLWFFAKTISIYWRRKGGYLEIESKSRFDKRLIDEFRVRRVSFITHFWNIAGGKLDVSDTVVCFLADLSLRFFENVTQWYMTEKVYGFSLYFAFLTLQISTSMFLNRKLDASTQLLTCLKDIKTMNGIFKENPESLVDVVQNFQNVSKVFRGLFNILQLSLQDFNENYHWLITFDKNMLDELLARTSMFISEVEATTQRGNFSIEEMLKILEKYKSFDFRTPSCIDGFYAYNCLYEVESCEAIDLTFDIVTKNNKKRYLCIPGISGRKLTSFAVWLQYHRLQPEQDIEHTLALIVLTKLVEGVNGNNPKLLTQARKSLERIDRHITEQSNESSYNGCLVLEQRNDWDKNLSAQRYQLALCIYCFDEARTKCNLPLQISYLDQLIKVCQYYEHLNSLTVVPNLSKYKFLQDIKNLKIQLAKEYFLSDDDFKQHNELEVMQRKNVDLLLIQKTWLSYDIKNKDDRDSYNKCVEKIIKYDFNQDFVFHSLKDVVERFAATLCDVLKTEPLNKNQIAEFNFFKPSDNLTYTDKIKITKPKNKLDKVKSFSNYCKDFVFLMKFWKENSKKDNSIAKEKNVRESKKKKPKKPKSKKR